MTLNLGQKKDSPLTSEVLQEILEKRNSLKHVNRNPLNPTSKTNALSKQAEENVETLTRLSNSELKSKPKKYENSQSAAVVEEPKKNIPTPMPIISRVYSNRPNQDPKTPLPLKKYSLKIEEKKVDKRPVDGTPKEAKPLSRAQAIITQFNNLIQQGEDKEQEIGIEPELQPQRQLEPVPEEGIDEPEAEPEPKPKKPKTKKEENKKKPRKPRKPEYVQEWIIDQKPEDYEKIGIEDDYLKYISPRRVTSRKEAASVDDRSTRYSKRGSKSKSSLQDKVTAGIMLKNSLTEQVRLQTDTEGDIDSLAATRATLPSIADSFAYQNMGDFWKEIANIDNEIAQIKSVHDKRMKEFESRRRKIRGVDQTPVDSVVPKTEEVKSVQKAKAETDEVLEKAKIAKKDHSLVDDATMSDVDIENELGNKKKKLKKTKTGCAGALLKVFEKITK